MFRLISQSICSKIFKYLAHNFFLSHYCLKHAKAPYKLLFTLLLNVMMLFRSIFWSRYLLELVKRSIPLRSSNVYKSWVLIYYLLSNSLYVLVETFSVLLQADLFWLIYYSQVPLIELTLVKSKLILFVRELERGFLGLVWSLRVILKM